MLELEFLTYFFNESHFVFSFKQDPFSLREQDPYSNLEFYLFI